MMGGQQNINLYCHTIVKYVQSITNQVMIALIMTWIVTFGTHALILSPRLSAIPYS